MRNRPISRLTRSVVLNSEQFPTLYAMIAQKTNYILIVNRHKRNDECQKNDKTVFFAAFHLMMTTQCQRRMIHRRFGLGIFHSHFLLLLQFWMKFRDVFKAQESQLNFSRIRISGSVIRFVFPHFKGNNFLVSLRHSHLQADDLTNEKLYKSISFYGESRCVFPKRHSIRIDSLAHAFSHRLAAWQLFAFVSSSSLLS